ncbi:unnamed protein product, partial [Ectocarpus fasciculatus]
MMIDQSIVVVVVDLQILVLAVVETRFSGRWAASRRSLFIVYGAGGNDEKGRSDTAGCFV